MTHERTHRTSWVASCTQLLDALHALKEPEALSQSLHKPAIQNYRDAV